MTHPRTADNALQLPAGDDRASASERASYTTAENGLNEKDMTKTREFDVYGDEDTAESMLYVLHYFYVLF